MIGKEPFDRRNISFYRYVRISDPEALKEELLEEWGEMQILGRAYIAKEGINAQLSVPEPSYQGFEEALQKRPHFQGIRVRKGLEERNDAFLKLRIKVRPKIVADGLGESAIDLSKAPEKLSPEAFHQALESKDRIVVDMRNHYESEVGRFQGALTPDTETFREELPEVLESLKGQEDKEILLYCTGGIRCEKAGAYLKANGFRNVKQLDGGIIEYGRTVREKGLASKFIGKNFVFDERLGERVTGDVIAHCHQCGARSDRQVNCCNKGCNLLFIQCESCAEQWEGCCGPECKEELHLDEEERRKRRKGKKVKKRFNKGKEARKQLSLRLQGKQGR